MTPDQRQDLDRQIKHIDAEWHPTNRKYVDPFDTLIERLCWVLGSIVAVCIALEVGYHWLMRHG